MTLISWTENLSVKIKTIDEQHKLLIDIINDFYDNISNRTNKENLSILISSLNDYIKSHICEEEENMKKLQYFAFHEHQKEHDYFITKVKEIEEKYNKGIPILSLNITMFLYDWLKNHIMIADKKCSEFYIEHGIN